MILGFLNDPHSRQLGLKELSQKLLEREPRERDTLREWILANVPGATKKSWGAHIAKASGALVAPYAIADADLTYDLHNALWEKIRVAGMERAHLREMRLIPVLLENERTGVRVDLPRLERDVAAYDREIAKADRWIQKYLATPDLNIDSDEALADAIERRYPDAEFLATPTGKRSTSKASLAGAIVDARLVAVLEYRATLATCLSTFMRPWLAVARETNGWIHTRWRATAQEEGGGARSGRVQSSPNFQNIPTTDKVEAAEQGIRKAKLKFLPLPRVRSYIVPDSEGSIIIDRDWSQQEPRILAHFEDDKLMQAYCDNPHLDLYVHMMEVMRAKGALRVDRKAMKIVVLALIYGLGLGRLAEKLGCSVEEAREFKNAILKTFPGIKDFIDDLKRRARANEPIRTWGGRVYYCEPSKIINGQLKEYAFRLVNTSIQATAADMIKEAMIRYHDEPRRKGRFILTAHDELVASVALRHEEREMKLMKEIMEGLPGFDVPFTSDGARGKNWAELEEAA